MDDTADNKDNFSTRSNKIMFFVDTSILTLVVGSYLIGKNEDCKHNIEDMILTYIIFKSIFWVFRLTIWLIEEYITQVGGYWMLWYLALWVPSMGAYYIIELIHFFRDDNDDWLNNASTKWTASLLITIEAIVCLLLFLVLAILVAVWVVWQVLISWKDTVKVVEMEALETERKL